jgi:chaperonin GroES
MMHIKPIGERVLLKQMKKEEKTKGGLYIPESAKEEKKDGEVVAVGTFKDGKELPLKKGDRVIYGGYSSDEIEIDDQKYLFVEFKDILGKVEVKKNDQ